MIRHRHRLLALWAAREVMRRPAEAFLLGASLLLVVLTTATPLLLSQGLASTADRVLAQSPALVVRRVTPGGWAPIPVREAVSAALSVPGVNAAEPRIWGTAAGPSQTVTVVGLDGHAKARLKPLIPGPLPVAGQCIAGPGVSSPGPGPWLLRNGDRTLSLVPIATLGLETGIVAQDLLLVDAGDARRLLAIPAGSASDLALEVFQEQEQAAILPELTSAFPWPVQISTRAEATAAYAAGFSRPGAIWLFVMIPALLALALIVVVTAKERFCRQKEIGLLKVLGWTSGDIVCLHLLKSLFVAFPAVALGLSGACLLVFSPAVRWPGMLVFGWTGAPPALYLDPTGSGLILTQVAGLALCPYLAAVLWPAARAVTGDPIDMLRES